MGLSQRSPGLHGARRWLNGRCDMKIKIRPHDPGVFDEADWLQMDGWLAKLRDDGKAGSAGDDHVQPAHGSDVRLEALAQPARAEVSACALKVTGSAVRAVIGDQLRMPVMWCEMGSSISSAYRSRGARRGRCARPRDQRRLAHRRLGHGWPVRSASRPTRASGRLAESSGAGSVHGCSPGRRHTSAKLPSAPSPREGSRYPDTVGGSPSAGPPEPAWRRSAPPFPRRRS